MTKEEIASVLEQIATLLELKGENPFKIRAYTNAARAIETFGRALSNLWLRAMGHWNDQSDPTAFCLGGIQRRSQPRPALERWKRRCRNAGTPVPAKNRFPRNA
jgi:hypothetical protein